MDLNMAMYDKFIDSKFGYLTIKRFYIDYSTGRRRVYAECLCDCGNQKSVRFDGLKDSKTISCGCKRYVDLNKKHGYARTRLYHTWQGMKDRCFNPNNREYKNYGGRGIKVCKEWLEFISFKEWAQSNGYTDKLTIERVDVNGDYCKENCKWIPLSEQLKNTSRNVFITFKGETLCANDWCKRFGLPNNSVIRRYRKGLPLEDVFKLNTKKEVSLSI